MKLVKLSAVSILAMAVSHCGDSSNKKKENQVEAPKTVVQPLTTDEEVVTNEETLTALNSQLPENVPNDVLIRIPVDPSTKKPLFEQAQAVRLEKSPKSKDPAVIAQVFDQQLKSEGALDLGVEDTLSQAASSDDRFCNRCSRFRRSGFRFFPRVYAGNYWGGFSYSQNYGGQYYNMPYNYGHSCGYWSYYYYQASASFQGMNSNTWMPQNNYYGMAPYASPYYGNINSNNINIHNEWDD